MSDQIKIAIVDDSGTFRFLIKKILEMKDFVVDSYESAEDLFKIKATLTSYNLFIMDINIIGGMSGITALENIRSYSYTKKTPVIIITGEPSKKAIQHIKTLKVNDVIVKPIDPANFIDRVLKALGIDENESEDEEE